MAKMIELTNAVFDSINTATKIYNKHLEEEADLSTKLKSIHLKNVVDEEFARIRNSSDFQNWSKDVDDLYSRLKGEMSNKDSPFYCRNNLQGEQFSLLLEQSRANTINQVQTMADQEAKKSYRIVIDKEIQEMKQLGVMGKELYDKSSELIKDARRINAYTQEEMQQKLAVVYYDAYNTTYDAAFDAQIDKAIENGDSFNKVWEDMQWLSEDVMKYNPNDIPVGFDKTQVDTQLKKKYQQRYDARIQDMQQTNANKLADLYITMQQSNAEGKVNIALQGQTALRGMKGNKLSENDKIKYANYFKLEEYYGSGARGSSSQRKAAADKLDVQDYMDFYFNAIENGDASTVYNAWKDCQDDMLEEFKNVTGNQNASIIDLEKAYPKVGTFLNKAKDRLPPDFKDVINYAENVVKSTLNTKDDKEAYKEELNSTLDLVYDIVFDADIKSMGPDAKKELKTRVTRAINANLGGVLQKQKDYKQYFDKDYAGLETLSDYRVGVIQSKEARMAQAMRERDANPDLVYTKANGLEVPYAMQEGLARLENDERSELKDLLISRMGANGLKALIEKQTGQPVEDLDSDFNKIVKASYESDGRNDVTANRRFTIDGTDYRFRTEDGKHIILEEKKNGTQGWQQVKTVSQQKEYDSPKAVTKRTEKEVTNIVNKTDWKKTSIPEGGFTYTDDDGKKQKLTYTDPEGEEKTINQAYWKHLRTNEKKRIIMEWMEKDPEAAKKWLDKLDSK